ncbi:hypothetical protein JCM6882_004961 [Rhodosporidiobolus microsporus]
MGASSSLCRGESAADENFPPKRPGQRDPPSSSLLPPPLSSLLARLPQELSLHILELVWSEDATNSAAWGRQLSLLSRQTRTAGQRLVFHTLQPRLHPYSRPDFTRLVRHFERYPHLGQHVRWLTLEASREHRYAAFDSTFFEQRAGETARLLDLCAGLESLAHTLREQDCPRLERMLDESKCKESLRRLDLTLDSPVKLDALFAAASVLHHLSDLELFIVDTGRSGVPAPESCSSGRLLRLKTFTLRSHHFVPDLNGDPILHAFLSFVDLSTLTHLTLATRTLPQSLLPLLPACACLTSLTLSLVAAFDPAFSLALFDSLSSLSPTLRQVSLYSRARPIPPLPLSLTELLAALPPTLTLFSGLSGMVRDRDFEGEEKARPTAPLEERGSLECEAQVWISPREGVGPVEATPTRLGRRRTEEGEVGWYKLV